MPLLIDTTRPFSEEERQAVISIQSRYRTYQAQNSLDQARVPTRPDKRALSDTVWLQTGSRASSADPQTPHPLALRPTNTPTRSHR